MLQETRLAVQTQLTLREEAHATRHQAAVLERRTKAQRKRVDILLAAHRHALDAGRDPDVSDLSKKFLQQMLDVTDALLLPAGDNLKAYKAESSQASKLALAKADALRRRHLEATGHRLGEWRALEAKGEAKRLEAELAWRHPAEALREVPFELRHAAVKLLAETYRSVFREFDLSGQDRLRLLPVSGYGGCPFSGAFQHDAPSLTKEAMLRGFSLLDPSQRRRVAGKQVDLCILNRADLPGFVSVGFNPPHKDEDDQDEGGGGGPGGGVTLFADGGGGGGEGSVAGEGKQQQRSKSSRRRVSMVTGHPVGLSPHGLLGEQTSLGEAPVREKEGPGPADVRGLVVVDPIDGGSLLGGSGGGGPSSDTTADHNRASSISKSLYRWLEIGHTKSSSSSSDGDVGTDYHEGGFLFPAGVAESLARPGHAKHHCYVRGGQEVHVIHARYPDLRQLHATTGDNRNDEEAEEEDAAEAAEEGGGWSGNNTTASSSAGPSTGALPATAQLVLALQKHKVSEAQASLASASSAREACAERAKSVEALGRELDSVVSECLAGRGSSGGEGGGGNGGRDGISQDEGGAQAHRPLSFSSSSSPPPPSSLPSLPSSAASSSLAVLKRDPLLKQQALQRLGAAAARLAEALEKDGEAGASAWAVHSKSGWACVEALLRCSTTSSSEEASAAASVVGSSFDAPPSPQQEAAFAVSCAVQRSSALSSELAAASMQVLGLSASAHSEMARQGRARLLVAKELITELEYAGVGANGRFEGVNFDLDEEQGGGDDGDGDDNEIGGITKGGSLLPHASSPTRVAHTSATAEAAEAAAVAGVATTNATSEAKAVMEATASEAVARQRAASEAESLRAWVETTKACIANASKAFEENLVRAAATRAKFEDLLVSQEECKQQRREESKRSQVMSQVIGGPAAALVSSSSSSSLPPSSNLPEASPQASLSPASGAVGNTPPPIASSSSSSSSFSGSSDLPSPQTTPQRQDDGANLDDEEREEEEEEEEDQELIAPERSRMLQTRGRSWKEGDAAMAAAMQARERAQQAGRIV